VIGNSIYIHAVRSKQKAWLPRQNTRPFAATSPAGADLFAKDVGCPGPSLPARSKH